MPTTLAPSQKRKRSPEQRERDAKKKRDDRAEFNRLKEAERIRQESQVIDLVQESEEEEQEEDEHSEWDDDEMEEVEDEEAELQAELRVTRSRAQIGIDGDKEVIAFTTSEQEKRDQIASDLRIKELKVASDLKVHEIKTKGMIDIMLAIVHKQQSGDPIDERILKLINGEHKFLLQ